MTIYRHNVVDGVLQRVLGKQPIIDGHYLDAADPGDRDGLDGSKHATAPLVEGAAMNRNQHPIRVLGSDFCHRDEDLDWNVVDHCLG